MHRTATTRQATAYGTVCIVQYVRGWSYSDGRSGAEVVFRPVCDENEASRVIRGWSGPGHEGVVLAHVLGRRQQETQRFIRY
jgi:hypothetical protein